MIRRKILIVCYFFHPSGDVAAKRILRFVRYFPYWGWDPAVLCAVESHYDLRDDQLGDFIPAGVPIYRTPSLFPRHLFARMARGLTRTDLRDGARRPCFLIRAARAFYRLLGRLVVPDLEVFWTLLALWNAVRIVRKEKIDAVLLSGPPYSTMLLGPFLRRFTKARVILDFRDWRGSFAHSAEPRDRGNRFVRFLERVAMESSHGVITPTKPIERELQRLHPQVHRRAFVVIGNSFDRELFINVRAKKFDRFTILHFGNFYGTRKMEVILRGLRRFIDRERCGPEQIQFLNYASRSEAPIDLIDELGLTDFVRLNPFVPYREGLALLLGSDVLLAVLGEGEKLLIPAKVYDYLAAGRPILAVLPKNNPTEDLLLEVGAGVVADVSDPEDVAASILRLYKMSEGEFRPRNVDRYSIGAAREPFTRFMASLFEGAR